MTDFVDFGTGPPAGALGSIRGVHRHGRIELDVPVQWPDGTVVRVVRVDPVPCREIDGHFVVIGGFGLAGRGVAELLDHARIPYAVIESNTQTVQAQAALGRRMIPGDASEEACLREAGISNATVVALTMPDEEAAVRATVVARRLNPQARIICRTRYSSAGLRASAGGADAVITAEQAVALRFYDLLARTLGVDRRGLDSHGGGS